MPLLAAADQALRCESEVQEVESLGAKQEAEKEEVLPLAPSVNPSETEETVQEKRMRFEQATSGAASDAVSRPTRRAHKNAQLFENQ